jgi:hypothetical protein
MYLKPDADEQITIRFPGFVTGKYPDYLGITISYNPEEGPSWGKIQNEENYIEISSYGDDFIEGKFYFHASVDKAPPSDYHIIEGNFKAINFGRD